MTTPRRVVGLDGCPTGWVAVHLEDGAVDDVEVVEYAAEVVHDDVRIAAVDIPIGLCDGDRDADRAARRLLTGRASSVFSAPVRTVVDAFVRGEVADHASASARSLAATGKGLSQQAWRLVPKIAEVDDLAARGAPVVEAHPEVAFALVAGAPLPRKTTWAGVETRRSLLRRLGIELPDRFVGDDRVAPDDVLDAAVVAWVADGVATGAGHLTVPDHPTQQDHGRAVVIHARQPPQPVPGPRTRPRAGSDASEGR